MLEIRFFGVKQVVGETFFGAWLPVTKSLSTVYKSFCLKNFKPQLFGKSSGKGKMPEGGNRAKNSSWHVFTIFKSGVRISAIMVDSL